MVSEELAFLDSISGALIGAGTAADTDIGIDYVLVFALGNSLDGALLSAGTALQASIGNFVSHEKYLLSFFQCAFSQCTYILAWIFKNAIPFL